MHRTIILISLASVTCLFAEPVSDYFKLKQQHRKDVAQLTLEQLQERHTIDATKIAEPHTTSIEIHKKAQKSHFILTCISLPACAHFALEDQPKLVKDLTFRTNIVHNGNGFTFSCVKFALTLGAGILSTVGILGVFYHKRAILTNEKEIYTKTYDSPLYHYLQAYSSYVDTLTARDHHA